MEKLVKAREKLTSEYGARESSEMKLEKTMSEIF
jgi:hypothetical protein